MNKRQTIRDWFAEHPDQLHIDRHDLAKLLGVTPEDVSRARAKRQTSSEDSEWASNRITDVREQDARYTHRVKLRGEVGYMANVRLKDWRDMALEDPAMTAAIEALEEPLRALWTLANEHCLLFELSRAQREQRAALENSPVGRLAQRLKLTSGGQVVHKDWRLIRTNTETVIAIRDDGVQHRLTGRDCCMAAARLAYGETEHEIEAG